MDLPDRQIARNHEDVFFRKDGSAVDAVCANAPLELDGRRVGVIFILHDISERKRDEVGLQRYAKRLENLRAIDLAILSSQRPQDIAEVALQHLAGWYHAGREMSPSMTLTGRNPRSSRRSACCTNGICPVRTS